MRYSILLPILALGALGLNLLASPSDKPTLIRSAKSGAWSDTATWEGGKVPSAGVQVLVRPTHIVTYDVKSEAVIRSLHIGGVLSFAHDKDTLLEVGLIRIHAGEKIEEEGFEFNHPEKSEIKPVNDPGTAVTCTCCDGKPALLVGTQERPIDANHTAQIRLHYIEGMNKESCPAIVCCAGRMDFHGAVMSRTWVKLGATVNPRKGAISEITLAESVIGWKPGDQLIVTTTGQKDNKQSRSEETTIKAIDGTKVTLTQPLKFAHEGEGEYRAEVANLSRNVIVESADPKGVRAHTMYHHGSSGSISYAEFRRLGKKDVLGRYSLHFHLCGNSMRGSSVIGASIHDSDNRWLTIHGTDYLVVRDCIGYKSVGHGYFLEDGTEVYNVLDRNLAVQAEEGKPLPKQLLPFDKNDGAGFWWANSHNTFTRNVAADCGQYGFRFDAAPRAGAIVNGRSFGEPKKEFDLTRKVRHPDGTTKGVDVRTLPFVRFEGNESHSNAKWGLNLGQHTGGKVGPDPSTPFHIRDMKIWEVVGGWGVEVPNVLIEGMTIHKTAYGVRESQYVAQDYRRVKLTNIRGHIHVASLEDYTKAGAAGEGNNRTRLPGWPAGKGDGGPRVQSPTIEVAKLTPIDKLPPITVITHVRKVDGGLKVRGTTSDDGVVKKVVVNGKEAKPLVTNFGEWELVVEGVKPGTHALKAHAEDDKGNVEKTPHELTVVVR